MGAEASMASAIQDKASGILGAGYSLYSAISEGRKKRKAQKALEGLVTPEEKNVAENLQVSTRGADLRTQEAGRNTATSVDALKSGGARALIGGIGNVQANNNAVTAEIGADLDEQQKNIDIMKAEEERRLQGIRENRYQNDVSALSSQIDVADDAKKQAIANAYSGFSGINIGGASDKSTMPNNSMNPAKATPVLKGKRNSRYTNFNG